MQPDKFSSAIVAKHELTGKNRQNLEALLSELQLSAKTPPIRILLAVADLELRENLFAGLSTQNYLLHSVLRAQNLSKDPLYFSPHIIICDDQVAFGKNK